MKVHWLGKNGKNKKSELSKPLLPPGNDDDTNTTTSTNTNTATNPHYSDITSPKSEVTAATAAIANNYAPPRRSSTFGAKKRRHKKIHKIQSHASHLSNVSVGNVSDTGSINDSDYVNVTTATSMPTMLSKYDRTESEVTDFGGEFDDDDDDDGDAEKDVPREKMTPAIMAKNAAVVLVTTAGIASYLVAFVASLTFSSVAATIMVGVAGGVCLLTVPLVLVSEYRLTHMPTIRKRVNHLRQVAQRFQREVEILIMAEEDLRAEVEFLMQGNEQLERVVEDNGGNVDELVELVQENQFVLRQMKENIRQVVLQSVVKLVLQSDIDRDGIISKKESNILAKRLSLSLQIYGIVFDEQKFHRAVGLSPSLNNVMVIVKRLLPDKHDRISSFYDVESDSDEDNGEEEKEDVYDMFYVPVDEQFDRGCADSILLCKEYVAEKGERPRLMSISPSLSMSVRGLRCDDVGCDC